MSTQDADALSDPAAVAESRITGANVEGLEGFHSTLSRIFADQQKKALEFKMVFSEGIGQAASAMEAQGSRIAELLRSHEEMARSMQALEQQIVQHEATQAELEGKTATLRQRRDALVERNEKLESERTALRAQVTEANTLAEKTIEQNAALQQELDRFERQSEEVARESGRLEKRRDKLRDDVARLTQLRDEYLAQIDRFKEDKDDLTDV